VEWFVERTHSTNRSTPRRGSASGGRPTGL
jgi:hypothetical protein